MNKFSRRCMFYLTAIQIVGCSAEPVATSMKRRYAEQAAAGAGSSQNLPAVEGSGDLSLKGQQLFEKNCQMCHNESSTPVPYGVSLDRLDTLLNDSAIGAIHIGAYQALVDGDTAAIQSFLSESGNEGEQQEVEDAEPENEGDEGESGAALALQGKQVYDNRCAGCHNNLPMVEIGGTTEAQIKALPNVSPDQHAAPVAALQQSDYPGLVEYLKEL